MKGPVPGDHHPSRFLVRAFVAPGRLCLHRIGSPAVRHPLDGGGHLGIHRRSRHTSGPRSWSANGASGGWPLLVLHRLAYVPRPSHAKSSLPAALASTRVGVVVGLGIPGPGLLSSRQVAFGFSTLLPACRSEGARARVRVARLGDPDGRCAGGARLPSVISGGHFRRAQAELRGAIPLASTLRRSKVHTASRSASWHPSTTPTLCPWHTVLAGCRSRQSTHRCRVGSPTPPGSLVTLPAHACVRPLWEWSRMPEARATCEARGDVGISSFVLGAPRSLQPARPASADVHREGGGGWVAAREPGSGDLGLARAAVTWLLSAARFCDTSSLRRRRDRHRCGVRCRSPLPDARPGHRRPRRTPATVPGWGLLVPALRGILAPCLVVSDHGGDHTLVHHGAANGLDGGDLHVLGSTVPVPSSASWGSGLSASALLSLEQPAGARPSSEGAAPAGSLRTRDGGLSRSRCARECAVP